MSIDSCLDMKKYEKYRQKRLLKHGIPSTIAYPNIKEILHDKGYHIFKGVFDIELLKQLRTDTKEAFKSGEKYVRKGFAKGRFSKIMQPLQNCPSTIPIAFNKLCLDVAQDYFECVPAVVTANLRTTHITKHGPDSVLLWHTDRNCPKLLKFFFYMNDVGEDDGPFTYMEGSDNDKPLAVDSKNRWTDDEVLGIWSKDRIVKLTANFGDVIVCNTRGMHKGSIPTNKQRTMFTVNYAVHSEKWAGPSFKIRQDDYDKLTELEKRSADLLKVK